jgi:hypothetical protein
MHAVANMFQSVKSSLRKPKVAKVVSRRDRKKYLAEKRQLTVDLHDDEMDEKQLFGDNNAATVSTTGRGGPNLCRMIADGEWKEIQELMTTPKEDVDIIDEDGAVTRELIVHHACAHRAPVSVLRSLSSEYWKSLYHADKDGRFPIHVAALNGAGSDILSFLISLNCATAGIKDALGKTPLHYICEEFLDKNKDANSLQTHQDMFWTVGLLIKSAPSSVNVEDNEEMNPIEYAIATGAHVGIIKEMQKASRSCWRARQKWEGWRKHAEYAQYLQDQSSPCLGDSKPLSCSNSAA